MDTFATCSRKYYRVVGRFSKDDEPSRSPLCLSLAGSVQVSSMWSGSVQGRHMARLGAFLCSFIKRKVLVPYRILK
ncbi:hypothetical protein RchiOBHm_Chr5g0079661 [Rosa chinensis]|uniref:Uncharacterized protein n=1 Tax=Rosa chinensis TaxID=74649 RepID=A0A2P6QMJ9_ROSCH|nr:hypothetical protein RchiOBHm_Chr5g0079661 [Rosa chinensis]